MPPSAGSDLPSEVSIILVHGACHGAWCWEDVQHHPSLGDWVVKALELPMSSLRDDADEVRIAVRDAKARGHAVLLVAHSYGGLVISEGGHDADRLVFVAATMPDPGESASQLMDRLVPPELADALVVSQDGAHASIDPSGATQAFYNRCTAEQAAAATARLRPMAMRAFEETVDRPAWREVPASYVVCTDDHAMYPKYQRERAELLGDQLVLDADHSPFLTATAELAMYLDAMAQRVATAIQQGAIAANA